MATLPINQFDSGAPVCASDEATAIADSQAPVAVADIQSSCGEADGGISNQLSMESRLTPPSPQEAIADLLEAIGGEYRFQLDVEKFMEAIEPPPLFLQTA